ncbi:hypothetical protein Goshw_001780, partial [Gossypium schwendimanii]|nr:hypothetical protein [Gossypium schwendimanii]
MEEIQSQSDHYRSSSSSASSPASRVPAFNFFYLRKPGSLGQPISFEDSPEWEDTDADVRVEEGGGDSINAATTSVSPSLSKLNSGSLPSPHLPEGAAVARKIAGASVAWKDLTVTIEGKREYSDNVVKGSNGYALPGTMTVIMGPAKSGKSTLLRAIAGRLPPAAKMYGEIFVNGARMHMPYGSYGFVDLETTLIGSLTVREYLYYSAVLQLPGFFSQKKSVVEEAIHAMSLGDFANKLIGGHCFMKGLPSGERRRVAIARELVMRPHILFIDEPLYHLDSVSALLMMVTLKKLTSTGCTLIFTLNQSSTEVFGLFDRICLLSNGNTLFFGETLACLQHFSNAGFPCPIMQSPSDHFLRAINTDFDRIIAMCKNWQDDNGDFSAVNMDTAVAICTLEATYKSSADAAAVETMILRLTEKEGPLLKSKGKASNATRIAVLTWRSLLIMSREFKYYWLRLILYMLLTLCIGTIFSGLGHSLSSVVTRVTAIFVFVSFTSLLSIAGVPVLMKEIKVILIIFCSIMMAICKFQPLAFTKPWNLMIKMHDVSGGTDARSGLFQNPKQVARTCVDASIIIHCFSHLLHPGVNFDIGQVRSISGFQALHSAYDISPRSNAKWENVLWLCNLGVSHFTGTEDNASLVLANMYALGIWENTVFHIR